MSNLMTYKGYNAAVELDAEVGAFNGRVSGLRDVLHFQGSSFHELEAAFHEAVDDYLAWCAELGHEPEKAFSGRVLVRMNSELHRAIAMRADREGTSITRVVVDALEHYLQRQKSSSASATMMPAGPRT